MHRFYINDMDLEFYDFNYVVLPDGKKIPYSFMCTKEEHMPPDGYYLVYETDGDYIIEFGGLL